jgi:hypothetical protein
MAKTVFNVSFAKFIFVFRISQKAGIERFNIFCTEE